jgi:hypothetical protein
MPKVSVRITKNLLPDIIRRVPERARKMTEVHAERVLNFAEEEVPVLTGYTKDDLHIEATSNGHNVVVDDKHFVQNGTSRKPANPFMTRAVERARPAWDEAVHALAAEFEGKG